MNKVYKHKILWWIASLQWDEYYYIDSVKCWHFIDKRILLEWQDREEIVEKDFIDNIIEEITIKWFCFSEYWKIEFRKAIEKYTKKVKKFIRDDVAQWKHSKNIVDLQNMTITDTICMFLDDHNIFDTKTE